MSILSYLHKKQPRDHGEFLPEPKEVLSSLSERSLVSANNEVHPIADTAEPKSKCQKTWQHFYSGEIRATIGRYVSINEPIAASH